MVWTTPKTFSTGDSLTSEDLNVYLRDNFNETAPAKAKEAGGFFVVADFHEIMERRVHQDFNLHTGSTTSTSYGDLTGSYGTGPTVTVDTGTTALVIMGAHLWNSTAGATVLMGHEVTGDSTLGAGDSLALLFEPASATQTLASSYWALREDLTPGTNTFTAKYRVTSGTGSFIRRRLMVIPL